MKYYTRRAGMVERCFFIPVLFESSVFQQRGSSRFFAAEILIHHIGIVDTSGSEDISSHP